MDQWTSIMSHDNVSKICNCQVIQRNLNLRLPEKYYKEINMQTRRKSIIHKIIWGKFNPLLKMIDTINQTNCQKITKMYNTDSIQKLNKCFFIIYLVVRSSILQHQTIYKEKTSSTLAVIRTVRNVHVQ